MIKKVHKLIKSDINCVVGQKTVCGINTFYTDKETESYIWRNVTCKRCLKAKLKRRKE